MKTGKEWAQIFTTKINAHFKAWYAYVHVYAFFDYVSSRFELMRWIMNQKHSMTSIITWLFVCIYNYFGGDIHILHFSILNFNISIFVGTLKHQIKYQQMKKMKKKKKICRKNDHKQNVNNLIEFRVI